MKIAQIVAPGASEYERKSQRVDLAALSQAGHEVAVYDDPRGADIAHVYGPAAALPAELRGRGVAGFRGGMARWLGHRATPQPRNRATLIDAELAAGLPPELRGRGVAGSRGGMAWWLRHGATPQPRNRATLIDAELDLPEAVEEIYWTTANGQQPTANSLGSFARKSIKNIVEQTFVRLHRTRDDIEWRLFERPPSPEELAGVAVWVDPALDEGDRDGFVAEALVAGRVVVASRTAANVQRLEKGRTGFLVAPGDANELTHAILAALFKPELGEARTSAARQTISKFRARFRLRALLPIYESHLE